MASEVVVDSQVKRIIEQAKEAAQTDPTYLIDMLKSCGRK